MKRSARIAGIIASAVILFTGWYALAPSTYTSIPSSKLWVEGTSTMHDFTCQVATFEGIFNTNVDMGDAIAGLMDVEVTVPVDELKCGNGTMDKKMREALKADDHKEIRYEMTDVAIEPAATAGVYQLKAKGNLTLAGAQRPIDIAVEGTQLADGTIRFVGSTVVKMSDFGIKRPSAALGTIKTGDDVTVRFEVVAAASEIAGR